jgi:hypothetical protein
MFCLVICKLSRTVICFISPHFASLFQHNQIEILFSFFHIMITFFSRFLVKHHKKSVKFFCSLTVTVVEEYSTYSREGGGLEDRFDNVKGEIL